MLYLYAHYDFFQCSNTKYMCYSPASMTAAYMKVKETGAAIQTTARKFGVPESSLRHKLSERVNPEAHHPFLQRKKNVA